MAENDDIPMLFSTRHEQHRGYEMEMSTDFRGSNSTSIDIPTHRPYDTGGRNPTTPASSGGWPRWSAGGLLRRRGRRATSSVAPESKMDVDVPSGPRGLCGNPNCKICPPALHAKKTHPDRLPTDSKLRKMLYEDTRGWAKKLSSSLSSRFPIMYPDTNAVQRWNRFFIVTCLLAIFVDPLFFFVLAVKQEYKCIVFDRSYAVGVAVVRSLTDFFYLIHMILQFRLAYVDPKSRVIGAGEFVEEPKKIALHYIRGYFALDVFNVLPLPQVLILRILPHTVHFSGANNAKNLLRATVLVQYLPRIYRFLPLLAGQSATRFIYESAWVNFVINLLMFILAGHVVGSCWYLLGLQRVNQCLRDGCKNFTKSVNSGSCMDLIDCGYGDNLEGQLAQNRNFWIGSTQADNCFQTGDNGNFNYGIYKSAVELTTKNGFTRYIYSLFWGFQQISTLAGNQVPSYFVWEVIFTMGIIGLGLFLFALLIGSMQNFLLALGRRRLEMQLRRHDVEQWMSHRCLPDFLKNHVREAERLNWSATRGVNEDELIENLPEDLQKKIRRHLFKFLEKVRLFSLMDDQLLDSVCEKLRQNFYISGSDILSKGAPVDKMIFVVRGTMEIEGADGNKTFLSEGSVCGEELLAWYLDNSSSSRNDGGKFRFSGQYLLSNRKVSCTTNVEAFTLHAADLEDISSLFARFLRLPRVQGAIRYESNYWRSMMANRIQVAWRYRKRRLSRFHESSRGSGSHGGGR